jgi:hypothetical protein
MSAKPSDRKPVEMDMMLAIGVPFDDCVADLQPLAGHGAALALKRKGNMGRGFLVSHTNALAR